MDAGQYRDIVRIIAKRVIKKRFPGLKDKEINEAANTIAINIHARMYGAEVDGVESPLWILDPKNPKLPNKTAKELLGQ